MKLPLRAFLAALATLLTSIISGVVAASLYRRFKYPQLSTQEADLLFDVQMAFLVTAVAVMAAIVAVVIYRARRRVRQLGGR